MSSLSDIPDSILKRKGAAKATLIPKEVLHFLNLGLIETANLTEWLAVDQSVLAKQVCVGQKQVIVALKPVLIDSGNLSSYRLMEAIGEALANGLSQSAQLELKQQLVRHRSDTVRCWGCFLSVRRPQLSLEQRLDEVAVFAADSHFGVREIAWMAFRPYVIRELDSALRLLQSWVVLKDPNLRRFAVECTRPRGVWAKHIDELKTDPAKAIQILDPLHSDPSRYVQDSVANWLNDASKSNAAWVEAVCKKWRSRSSSKHTDYILRRAMRSMQK